MDVTTKVDWHYTFLKIIFHALLIFPYILDLNTKVCPLTMVSPWLNWGLKANPNVVIGLHLVSLYLNKVLKFQTFGSIASNTHLRINVEKDSFGSIKLNPPTSLCTQ